MIVKTDNNGNKYIVIEEMDLFALSTGSYVNLPRTDAPCQLRFSQEITGDIGRFLDSREDNKERKAKHEKARSDIKPCPRCGSRQYKYKDREPGWSVIKCLDCKYRLTGSAARGTDPVAKWNAESTQKEIKDESSSETSITDSRGDQEPLRNDPAPETSSESPIERAEENGPAIRVEEQEVKTELGFYGSTSPTEKCSTCSHIAGQHQVLRDRQLERCLDQKCTCMEFRKIVK